MNNLSTDILYKIFGFLGNTDFINLILSSKYIYEKYCAKQTNIDINEFSNYKNETLYRHISEIKKKNILTVRDLVIYLLQFDRNKKIGIQKILMSERKNKDYAIGYGYLILEDIKEEDVYISYNSKYYIHNNDKKYLHITKNNNIKDREICQKENILELKTIDFI